jgi:hypothetical protein
LSTKTTNYELVKPATNETADIAVINSNMDIIDTQLKNNANSTSGATEALAAHQADETQHVPYAVASGSANTYAVTLSPAPTSLVAGMALAVKINVDSTGASTINVNGLGAISIKKANGTDVTNLKSGGIYTLRYNGTNFILQGEGASGTATASDLLSGKTATTDAGEITGTIPSKSAQIYTPTTADQTIAAGQYLSGAQTIKGDTNLIASNILSGKSIFGVAGGVTSKNYASGSIVSATTAVNVYNYADSSSPALSMYPITVSGLTFKPEVIVFISRNNEVSTIHFGLYNVDNLIPIITGGYTANLAVVDQSSNRYFVQIDGTILYVTPTGFKLAVKASGRSFYWWAWG